ncbi:MAG: deoxyuridine 5'-triphosphate nucleotidohydrolase [Anaerorhabdus sp.]|uniref:deoxyuridine 5'-triphosphate nucleotidohydrolase n=1 Tax=Anaerorhabdus sp. TaxID=1872524 RepID=UPI003A8571E3
MNKVAKFEKVSFEQFKEDWLKLFQDSEEKVREIYEGIILPKRATLGSAGYDFYIPIDMKFDPLEKKRIPTGIRVKIDEGWVLQLYPRSSLGFKYGFRLANTVGIIDADYYYSDNEGHIQLSLVNENHENLMVDLKKGEAVIQGIFVSFGITEDDNATNTRNGGFGSTNKR